MGRRRLIAPVSAAVLFGLAFAGFWVWITQTQDTSIVTWLGGLPVVLIFVIVGAFWVGFGLIAWWICERAFPPDDRDVTHENIARFLVVMTSFFVFVLGFVISQEWSNASAARNQVSIGAAGLYTAGYNNYPLPQPSKKEIEVALNTVGISMVCDELPSLKETGKGAEQTGLALVEAFNVVTGQPRAVQDLATYGNIADELAVLSEARRQWLSQADNVLPTVVLVSIFIASGFLLGAFVVQSTRSRRGHLASIIGLALLITLATGMVISLARPFAGAAQLNPESFAQGTTLSDQDCSNPDRTQGQ